VDACPKKDLHQPNTEMIYNPFHTHD